MALVFDPGIFQNNVFQVGTPAAGHVFQCNVFQNNVFQGICGVVTPPPRGVSDTSDPVFYDWWRKKRQEQEEKQFESPAPHMSVVEQVEPTSPAIDLAITKLRPETLAGISNSKSLDEIRALSENLRHVEREAVRLILDEFARIEQDDEDDIEMLLLQ